MTSFRFLFKRPTISNMPKQAFHADLDINGIEGFKRLQVMYDAQEFVDFVVKPGETCRFTYYWPFCKLHTFTKWHDTSFNADLVKVCRFRTKWLRVRKSA